MEHKTVENLITENALISHPLVYVDDYAQAEQVIRNSKCKEFVVLANNAGKRSLNEQNTGGKKVTLIRLRPSGSWNTVFRHLAGVVEARDGGQYGNATDLMFVSLLDSHDIASALRRHRTTQTLSCRELYFLESLKCGTECDPAIDLALGLMPNTPVPISYRSLSIAQQLSLTAFEFTRFTKPVHCVESTKNMHENVPFYSQVNFVRWLGKLKPDYATIRK